MHAPAELADIVTDILARIRDRAPRVHCITNNVAQHYTASMLLAAGAVPSMTIAAEEVVSFVASADALLVNLGTLDAERRGAIDAALGAAAAARMPWVLDPVFIDVTPTRAHFARKLVERAAGGGAAQSSGIRHAVGRRARRRRAGALCQGARCRRRGHRRGRPRDRRLAPPHDRQRPSVHGAGDGRRAAPRPRWSAPRLRSRATPSSRRPRRSPRSPSPAKSPRRTPTVRAASPSRSSTPCTISTARPCVRG